jgi:hypothetical protein
LVTKQPKKKLRDSTVGSAKEDAASLSAYCRTRVGNGAGLFLNSETDLRRGHARRFKEIVYAVASDLGGFDRMSALQLQLIRRAAALAVIAEAAEARIAQGQAPSNAELGGYIAISNAMRRLAHSLGLKRIPREIQSLDEYLNSRYGLEIDATAEAEARFRSRR